MFLVLYYYGWFGEGNKQTASETKYFKNDYDYFVKQNKAKGNYYYDYTFGSEVDAVFKDWDGYKDKQTTMRIKNIDTNYPIWEYMSFAFLGSRYLNWEEQPRLSDTSGGPRRPAVSPRARGRSSRRRGTGLTWPARSVCLATLRPTSAPRRRGGCSRSKRCSGTSSLETSEARPRRRSCSARFDYLLGNHAMARAELHESSARFSATGDVLGRAQCLLLLALTETAAGGYEHARTLLHETRDEFDRIGYRLGLAQCDVALAHADYRALDLGPARPRAASARVAFRELQNPRGEAACERLLAMLDFDADDFESASAHAERALAIFTRLQDPWGQLEASLLLAQVALGRGDADAEARVAVCDAAVLDEAEPRQHRHLTRAWLAQTKREWRTAAEEIEHARSCYHDWVQTGDHTPALLKRLSRLTWDGPARGRVELWLQGVEQSEADLSRFLVDAPSAPGDE